MNEFRSEKAGGFSPLQQELEFALHEEAMFAGTLLGDMASVRAASLAQRLEQEWRRTRGPVPVISGRNDAWETYLGKIKH